MKHTLTVEWWCAIDNGEPIQEHHEALCDHAKEHVMESMEAGNREGELLTSIDGVDYRGYWAVTTNAQPTA